MLTKRYPILVGFSRRLTMIKIKTIENRIPNVTRLITTTILNTKVTSIENKISDTTTFITTPKFNRLIKTNF